MKFPCFHGAKNSPRISPNKKITIFIPSPLCSSPGNWPAIPLRHAQSVQPWQSPSGKPVLNLTQPVWNGRYGGFHRWGYPKWLVYNGNPIKMDDLGVPLFQKTSIYPLCIQQFAMEHGPFSSMICDVLTYAKGNWSTHDVRLVDNQNDILSHTIVLVGKAVSYYGLTISGYTSA